MLKIKKIGPPKKISSYAPESCWLNYDVSWSGIDDKTPGFLDEIEEKNLISDVV